MPLFAVAVVALAAGLGGPALLRASGLAVDGGEPTLDPLRYATPAPTPVPVEAPPAAPAASLGGALPDLAALQTAIGALPGPTGRTAWAVVDPTTGRPLAGAGAEDGLVPASTQKLLTAAAALSVFGPDRRFATTLVAVEGGAVLVGGGDPYLQTAPADGYPAWASLTGLADAAAAALQAAGTTAIRLGWDDSWFAGPAWNENWDDDDSLYVTATSALWSDHGVTDGIRSQTPAADAAARFADLLRERGITVSQTASQPAPAGAAVLAEVSSPPLSVVIQEYLLSSDNDVAEVLFRQIARAKGGDGSLAAAHTALPGILSELGLWADGQTADDGSGLSRANRVSPLVLARAVALGLRDPAYRTLLAGLPTAGGDGTLARRFNDPDEQPGRGYVRAKTGSLTGVNTLAGFVQTRSGAILAFAFMSNDASDDSAAGDWADQACALLAAS
jgi:D-alanyl-D-alanine carboxypeptidase/D-alanyl-D-alanine-endopeptidase (penicillin-binding protein 4)